MNSIYVSIHKNTIKKSISNKISLIPIVVWKLFVWQYPADEQKGAQQGQSRLELQLPSPLPTSTVSLLVHTLPFQDVHEPVSISVAKLDCPENIILYFFQHCKLSIRFRYSKLSNPINPLTLIIIKYSDWRLLGRLNNRASSIFFIITYTYLDLSWNLIRDKLVF